MNNKKINNGITLADRNDFKSNKLKLAEMNRYKIDI